MLECKGLAHAVRTVDGSGRWLYRELDGVCPAGSLTAVVGPNGAGKTTLLRHVAGLLTRSPGVVTLDGRPWKSWARQERARKLAYLPQRPPVPDALTVLDLANLGRTPHRGWWTSEGPADGEAVARALQMADVEPLAGRSLGSLSGGELQRSMIARMLATEAPVLVLDEPTTSLDVRHALHVVELLCALARSGHTVLVALHELDLASRYADSVILLNGDGRWCWGPASSVLARASVEATFGVEVRGDSIRDLQLPAAGRIAIRDAVRGAGPR